MHPKQVLSVGQCFADQHAIARTLESRFAVQVVSSDTAADALERLRQGPFDLVLVNRIFDSDGSAGLDLIRQIKGEQSLQHLPVMLVSNYEASQQEALGLGAERGFGKAALGRPEMLETVGQYLPPRS